MPNHQLNPSSPFHKLPIPGAFFTSRGVGPEAGPYDGFSACDYTGDSPEHYEECRRRLSEEFGVAMERIILPRQVHSSKVAVPEEGDSIDGVDAIVTRQRGVIIGVNTADCVPVVMVDEAAGVWAVAHAGWRGAVGGVVENALSVMVRLGASPANVEVAFGPSICPNCFEVGPEVAEQFPPSAVVRKSEWPRPHVDLQGYISDLLRGLGVEKIHPFADAICTRCHPSVFFSARREGIKSGRNLTFLVS